MHNLIYISAASHLLTNEELVDILTVSRLNNSRLGITGLMLYHEGAILQILEGEETVLKTLYRKICTDSRHKGLIKMLDIPVNERSFEDWSMGFKQISKEDWSSLGGYLNLQNNEMLSALTRSGATHVISMIKSFATVNMGMVHKVR